VAQERRADEQRATLAAHDGGGQSKAFDAQPSDSVVKV
jgi:hypothetical protein